MSESSKPRGDKADAYAAHVKVGDAVRTPDGELWVVETTTQDDLKVVSAWRGADGRIYADSHSAVRTALPRELAEKVADARSVRR